MLVMDDTRYKLVSAEGKAKELFAAIEEGGLIVPGKTERQLIEDVVALAREEFGIEEFWHKKIVRAGINTLQPYGGDPPDRVIQSDDIVIVDFGPVLYGYEADLARTYVLGNDPLKLKIKQDAEAAWQEANAWYVKRRQSAGDLWGGKDENAEIRHSKEGGLTGAEFYTYVTELAERYGYEYGGAIAGHIVGPYPHEQLGEGNWGLDIHPLNDQDMFGKDPEGNERHWILEIHFVDRVNRIGGYFEQLMG